MKPTLVPSMVKLGGLAVVAALATASSASAQIFIYPTTTAFTDISATGTSPGTSGDDVELNITSAALSAAGFAGNELLPLANIRIGNNGGVIWTSAAGEVGYINSTTFGTMAASNLTTTGNGGSTAGQSFLAVMWDDTTPASAQTANALDWQVVGGNLILQWSNQAHFNAGGPASGNLVQFQAVVYGGATIASGAPLVDFVYNDTLYAAGAYQNDGGSSTIGYKNWSTVAAANDVQFGLGGGNDTITDPAFGDPTMKPKVGGHASSNNPNLPKAVRISGAIPSVPPTKVCAGDGTGTACPCGNSGAATNGCANSASAAGASLVGSGSASYSADTLVLTTTGAPTNAPCLYAQGTGLIAGGAVFNDGLGCITGTVIRLGTKTSVGGVSSYPSGSEAISTRGGNAPGGTRYYQAIFRDVAPYCTPAGANQTNAVQVTWGT